MACKEFIKGRKRGGSTVAGMLLNSQERGGVVRMMNSDERERKKIAMASALTLVPSKMSYPGGSYSGFTKYGPAPAPIFHSSCADLGSISAPAPIQARCKICQ